MKNRRVIIAGIGILLLLSSMSQVMAFKSKKPQYAAVALNEKGDKILKLVFDESQGTGKGYDTVYADLNFNGKLNDDKTIKGRIETNKDRTYINYPLMNLSIYYNDKAKGVRNPYRLELGYFQSSNQGRVERNFSVRVMVGLKDKSGEWQYSFGDILQTFDSPGKVQTTVLADKLDGIMITTKPEKGQLGIMAVPVTHGHHLVYCYKNGPQAKAHVEVKNSSGKVVHSENISADKLVPG